MSESQSLSSHERETLLAFVCDRAESFIRVWTTLDIEGADEDASPPWPGSLPQPRKTAPCCQPMTLPSTPSLIVLSSRPC